MWNIIMLENIGVKNMQKGTITIDIFLLMNLAQFFGARVCWCLLAGKRRAEKAGIIHLVWNLSLPASPGRARGREGMSCAGLRPQAVGRSGLAGWGWRGRVRGPGPVSEVPVAVSFVPRGVWGWFLTLKQVACGQLGLLGAAGRPPPGGSIHTAACIAWRAPAASGAAGGGWAAREPACFCALRG